MSKDPRYLDVHLVQMTSVDSVQKNLEQILDLCASIAPSASNPGLICLPENALYMRIQEGAPIPGISLEDPLFSQLAKLTADKNCTLHIGSSPIKHGKKLTNAAVIVRPNGQTLMGYQKLHLFDINLKNDVSIRESDVFAHGAMPQLLEEDGWVIGQSICYDIRFSELYNFYARLNADALLIPSAFLIKTGHSHWHILNRARAIESQCYVLSAAQCGIHRSGDAERSTFGHSLIIDPWGEIIAEGNNSTPQLLSATFDKDLIQSVRSQIPMHHHRRWHL